MSDSRLERCWTSIEVRFGSGERRRPRDVEQPRSVHHSLLASLVLLVAALTLGPAPAFAWGGNTPIVDCNDTVASIHPGAIEVENGLDDNCDGLADNVDGVPSTNPIDNDGDGVSIAQGDCNDSNPLVRPGLAESVGDRIDNDCDGLADEAPDNTPSNDATDQDGDGYTLRNDRIFGDLFEAAI